jgi:hypothetical protein
MTVAMTVYVHTTVLTEEWEEIEDEIAALLMKRGIDAHIDNPLTGNTTSTSSILDRQYDMEVTNE